MTKRMTILVALGWTLAVTAPAGAQVTGGILYVNNTHMP
jgi:hypothetical protein